MSLPVARTVRRTARAVAKSPALALLWFAAAANISILIAAPDRAVLVTLSIVGTSDLHGAALARNGLGGLPLLAGYVNNLRAARAADGGAVVLVDSGDTFQGGIESNLSEGALVVDAYNAMGYTAEAVGNHDFDFGSIDSPTGRQLPGDLRGALKARAAQARYPLLAANLIDDATGRPVEWPNVRPSVVVDAAGVKVGIVGLMTIDALRSTLPGNVRGLRVAPLGSTIDAEASRLRASGADLIVVAAHAGGRCERFDRPDDLSSCDMDSEIFRLANSVRRGLVDVIAAGHTHAALAHLVNGIAIVQPYSRGQAFDRVDVVFDRGSRRVARVQPFAPRRVCVQEDAATGDCLPTTEPGAAPRYEGRPVAADAAVLQAMAPALERVRRLQATRLGTTLDHAIGRGGDSSSPLGNRFADALLDAVPDADVAVVNSATRGLWADLADGPLTFGGLYDVFPFDNRVLRLTLSGAELRQWVANEIRQGRQGALGISGFGVRISCAAGDVHVELLRASVRPVHDDDRIVVVTIGSPTLSGSVAFAASGSRGAEQAAVVREVVQDWFRQPAHLTARQLDANHSLEYTDARAAGCVH